MADLKPIGSEKLQGMEKIARIMEIARYGETPKQDINLNETLSYTRILSDGMVYGIVKEKNGYILKKGINESSLSYMDVLQNRKYYNSYSQALKKLNFLAGELNRINENETGTNLFGEQKKFVLKTPKQQAPVSQPQDTMPTPPPPPQPTAEPVTPPSEPTEPASDILGDLGGDMGTEPSTEMPSEPMDDMGMGSEQEDGVEVTFKTIQKLTGKLGQKLRAFEETNEMSPEDVKYVLNSVLSALDLSVLEDSDIEEIVGKIEGEEEEFSAELSEPAMEVQPELTPSDEITVQPEVGENINTKVLDQLFSESKVEKVLSKYFVITEEEQKKTEQKQVLNFIKKKINKASVMDEIKNLSETIEQELTAEFVLTENTNAKFIGRTNLKNLIFDINGKQVKISPRGEVL